jgi:hypothetical protein
MRAAAYVEVGGAAQTLFEKKSKKTMSVCLIPIDHPIGIQVGNVLEILTNWKSLFWQK